MTARLGEDRHDLFTRMRLGEREPAFAAAYDGGVADPLHRPDRLRDDRPGGRGQAGPRAPAAVRRLRLAHRRDSSSACSCLTVGEVCTADGSAG